MLFELPNNQTKDKEVNLKLYNNRITIFSKRFKKRTNNDGDTEGGFIIFTGRIDTL